MANPIKIIIVAGPTSSGKTGFALKLANKLNGELINADSRQIYKYLDIGTNKGKLVTNKFGKKFLEGVPIHLIDFLEPDKRYNLFTFKREAEEKILEISKKGKTPIIVGGTGLYIDSVVKDYHDNSGLNNKETRLKLEAFSKENLQKEYLKLYKKNYLNNSDFNNKRRLIRQIEKYNLRSNSVLEKSDLFSTKYIIDFYYPVFELSELKKKIAIRVEEMFKEGLIEETQNVLKLGYAKNSIALQGIGYKEVLEYLDNKATLPETIKKVKTAHIKYAKRQITWFEGAGRNYKLKKALYQTF